MTEQFKSTRKDWLTLGAVILAGIILSPLLAFAWVVEKRTGYVISGVGWLFGYLAVVALIILVFVKMT
jgi:hypothetical protein